LKIVNETQVHGLVQPEADRQCPAEFFGNGHLANKALDRISGCQFEQDKHRDHNCGDESQRRAQQAKIMQS
jgi:hypothetical protein